MTVFAVLLAASAAVTALWVLWREAVGPLARAGRWTVRIVTAGVRRRRALALVPAELAKATSELAAVGVQLHVLTGHFLAYAIADEQRTSGERSRLDKLAGDVDAAHQQLRAHHSRLAALEQRHTDPEDHHDHQAA